jgi:putative ABC transport system substrate-binding protein
MPVGQSNRRAFIAMLGGAAAWPVVARGQQPAMPVIGFFSSRSPEDSDYLVAAFRRGLAGEGYVEGQNIQVEYLWARGQWDRLPALAADLVRRNVAVLVAAGGEPAVFAAMAATTSIPIVFGTGGDPVKLGIVASLSQPGANATGTVLMTTDLEDKRLGILHELVPNAELVAVLVNPHRPLAEATVNDVEAAIRKLGLRFEVFRASNEPELSAALDATIERRAGALLLTADPFFDTQRARILSVAAEHQLPAVYQFREYALAGGLMSYGPSIADNYRQFGLYTGRILKGEKPADLPIVRSTKFELVINLKTARALGLTVPPALLAVADEVIE